MSCGGSRHADFEKIHSAFLTHYRKDHKLGESRYAGWVKFFGLDETQSYYLQGAARAIKSKKSFEWANFLLQFVKEDKDAFYYKFEAFFRLNR
jgi:ribonuclease BN (tRNA processing enzyme)